MPAPDPREITSYDEVPYESHPFAQTHPDRLAMVATLLGMEPAPLEGCRVLELGCASGGNLIPIAAGLPASRCLGIELSERAVTAGKAMIAALRLRNVELRQASILEVGADLGLFDYIICHGVYSWVPAEVRDRILGICAQNLAPNGVAYVSYNTYPGWHLRGTIRDMMCYHARSFTDPVQKVRQATALVDFIAKSAPGKDTPYAKLLAEEREVLRGKPDSYLFHDHLETHNQPLYFHEFAERAEAKKLRYLAEAQVSSMAAHTFPAEVQKTLSQLAVSRVHGEQYMDFLRNRTFRQTLLCHEDVPLKHHVVPERIMGLRVASGARPMEANSPLADRTTVEFAAHQLRLKTSSPLMKTALAELARRWPQSVPFAELLEIVRGRLGVAGSAVTFERHRRDLATHLLRCYVTSPIIELHVDAPPFVLEPGKRPIASPLARWQAKSRRSVTNLRHENVQLSDAERQTLLLLNGRRERPALFEALLALVARGTLVARRKGEPVSDPETQRAATANALETILQRLARYALLVG
ncbi:MAG: hypothetical protein QOE70_3454 [Chthoniobacter sp.]|jgi:methyltransferase-like protein/SAM-dependent methyltransferase|nr:hypothetical protein [Chthoniobacter sp.]